MRGGGYRAEPKGTLLISCSVPEDVRTVKRPHRPWPGSCGHHGKEVRGWGCGWWAPQSVQPGPTWPGSRFGAQPAWLGALGRPISISSCFPCVSEVRTLVLSSQILWARPHGDLGEKSGLNRGVLKDEQEFANYSRGSGCSR